MIKFLIVAPQFQNKSGGVMVLHELCDSLNKLGYPSGIIFIHGGNANEQNFQYAISNDENLYMPNSRYLKFSSQHEVMDIINTGTVIYPDLIVGNPLNANRVIRYLLNANNSTFIGEYILSFSRIYRSDPDFVLFKPFHDSNFTDENSIPWNERTLNLTYFGKGPTFLECKIINGSILIQREWPQTKQQLATILRHCKFFFSYDCVSATNSDAMMCGAVPILMHDLQIPRDILKNIELGPFPKIDNFNAEGLPDSLIFDLKEVESTKARFKHNYFDLLNSWDLRVKLFVDDYLSKNG